MKRTAFLVCVLCTSPTRAIFLHMASCDIHGQFARRFFPFLFLLFMPSCTSCMPFLNLVLMVYCVIVFLVFEYCHRYLQQGQHRGMAQVRGHRLFPAFFIHVYMYTSHQPVRSYLPSTDGDFSGLTTLAKVGQSSG